MRISRLELDGIGPFEGAVFEIPAPPEGSRGELVLFEGPNGCGKTTIALAIALAAAPSMLRKDDLRTIVVPDSAWRGRFREQEKAALIQIEHRGRILNEQIESTGIEHAYGDSGSQIYEVSFRDGAISLDNQRRHYTYVPPFSEPSWMAFSFQGRQSTPILHTSGPREIDPVEWNRTNLGFGTSPASGILGQVLTNIDYGRARAAVYAQQATEAPDRTRFQEAVEAATARIERMEWALSTVLDRRVTIEFDLKRVYPRILFDGAEIPLEYLGEGLRSTVAWLADLLVRLELTPWDHSDARSPFEQDFWLILDEVEVNLHPRMQAHLFPALRRLFPNARIYATVHSPFAVAAAGEGHVFPIRPQRGTRLVTGPQEPMKLAHGQSLSWVVEEVFDTPSMFLDAETRRSLELHDQEVRSLLAGKEIDWPAFLERRRWLMSLNDEVATIVAMREVAVQRRIDAQLEDRSS